ncbi:hypothetical protein F5I97DRAFT_1886878 [Phlebopus sp. FC_14]|nr:hypothetical protein F5I97DRAFT_1886878 [Phlebopus sp. FC_14]
MVLVFTGVRKAPETNHCQNGRLLLYQFAPVCKRTRCSVRYGSLIDIRLSNIAIVHDRRHLVAPHPEQVRRRHGVVFKVDGLVGSIGRTPSGQRNRTFSSSIKSGCLQYWLTMCVQGLIQRVMLQNLELLILRQERAAGVLCALLSLQRFS